MLVLAPLLVADPESPPNQANTGANGHSGRKVDIEFVDIRRDFAEILLCMVPELFNTCSTAEYVGI